ncbi:hypothetical protein [Clostridium sp. D53t1_180928_C8]|uniref:hypothetical protein n=1 Tax=Clostridium sp. D53t1_180928_C8 TaxID=2787101 RepID=UPI001FABFC43|nr:hypothetical protein [Clostridium sp. D53t1_180928_C8]
MTNNLTISLQDDYRRNFWHNSIKNITLGFMLNVISLNFWGLQYILPTIGTILLYIGFRDLRNENKFFHSTWIFSIINIVINLTNLIYISTPLNIEFEHTFIRSVLLTTFRLIFLIVFREGLKNIFHKNNLTPSRDPILMLIIWYILVITLGLTLLGQLWLVFIIIIIYYFYTFYSLYELRYDLEDINCTTSNHNIKLSNKNIFISYIISCALLVTVCCLISNHIQLKSKEFIPVESSSTMDILINKGFPHDILNDIADEDISLIKDALCIESFSENLNFNSPGKINLKATTIFIELPDTKMYAIEFFNWENGESYWNDGFTITASEDLELINGRLLYENEGIKYTASIPRLNHGSIINTDLFGHVEQSDKISGAISYPFGSTDLKGYVLYKINVNENTTTFGCNIVNYIHYNTPFRLPYIIPEYQNVIFNNNLDQHCTNFSIEKDNEITY